ncbi:MAG TPA: HPF/RaiA family ribosome-associated protein [Kofleriaceae bacterium]|nr:HPF/RaiA family ribosome-associated protein [Kofleriaceae bacterium]
MQNPVEITFRGMAPSPAVEAAVTSWAERLGRFHPRIQHCRVWVELPHHHRRHGDRFQVKLVVSIPGDEIVVAHEHGHADVYLALADAFIAARRQLHDHACIRRGEIKHHHAA